MRTIVEDKRYKEQIEALKVDWQRLDEALSELTEAVSRIPENFPVVPGTALRRIQVIGFPGVPPLSVFFSFTDTQIHIHSAELLDQD
jgi:hypothetical protein